MGLVPLLATSKKMNMLSGIRPYKNGDIASLTGQINFSEENYSFIKELAVQAQKRALTEFNWDKVTEDHIRVFDQSN
jgi:hypothetical protein